MVFQLKASLTGKWAKGVHGDAYLGTGGTATQLVILPTHIPWIGQGGGILLLSYSKICVSGRVIFLF